MNDLAVTRTSLGADRICLLDHDNLATCLSDGTRNRQTNNTGTNDDAINTFGHALFLSSGTVPKC
jgi:hypothetical protein